MRMIFTLLVALEIGCTSAPNGGDSLQPGAVDSSDADCVMTTPTACPLNVARSRLTIDVHYPNIRFCRLQLLPTKPLIDPPGDFEQLAAGWHVSIQGIEPFVLSPELLPGVVEYSLGTEKVYVGKVTIESNSSETLAALIATSLGQTTSLLAIPLECPNTRGGSDAGAGPPIPAADAGATSSD